MARIRVLQLHNLAIGPLREESPFQAIREALKREDLHNVDYIVVCGGVTRDASPLSFQHAGQVLKDMARELLPPRVRTGNRMMIVPGPSDVPDPDAVQPDFSFFRQFHDSFYRNEFGIERLFDPERAELRDLKDLTLVGLTYWSSRDKQVCEERIRRFGTMLDGAMARMPNLAYVNTTPTLLVSAGTPLLLGDGRPSPEMQGIFNTNLKISCHLFGAGSLDYVSPRPFAHKHVSLGLGSENNSSSLWPLRLNLIELGNDDLEAPLISSSMRLAALRQRSKADPWERWTQIVPLEGHNLPSLEPDLEDLYSDFLDRLREKVLQREIRIVRVQGFPGSGLRDLFKRLTREDSSKIGGLPMRIHGHEWNDRAAWKRFLGKLPIGNGGVAVQLVAVLDPRFHALSNEGKKERLEEITEDFEGLYLQGFKLVHFADFSSLTVDLEGCDELDLWLTSEGIANLVWRYSYRVPLRSDELAHITGGYAGFSQRFLRAAWQGFTRWSGEQDVDERTPSVLIRSSFGVEEVKSTCKRFLDTMKSISGGPEVFDHVRKEVVAHYEGVSSGRLPVGKPIEVDFSKLPPPRFKPGAREVTARLERFDILRRTSSHHYEVRVVAPFLSRSECFVFFSYPRRERERAEKVKSFLEEKARREKTHLEVFTYTDDRPEPTSGILSDDLASILRVTNNLCVFHPGSDLAGWTAWEVPAWLQIWQSEPLGDFALIPILLGKENSSLPSTFLGNNYAISALDLEELEIAERIFGCLRYREEMRWGWD